MRFSVLSLTLVLAQFLLIVLLASPLSDLLSSKPAALIGALHIIGGIGLAAWAFQSMSRGTFSVMPEPTSKARLTQAGPYRWLRHPMYSAILLGALGATISHATLTHTLILIALTVVLLLKILREERYLRAMYEDYSDYRLRTKALIPFIY